MMMGRRWWQNLAKGNLGNDGPSFPTRQLFVLALVRICEPIAFMSVFPYVYYMVESFHVTENDQKIAFYAGMILSAFTFAEFSTGVFWGWMSDQIGRKPVLIMGLVGTAVSMTVFGFAPNLATALLARALGGMLNGNIGVLQTTVAEIVTVKEQQARAYSIMPFVWCVGSIIGPALGGALAQPCQNYPGLCRPGSLLDRFPFLLPNLVCIVVLVIGITIGVLFLEETHAEKKFRRDRGLALGRWLVSKVGMADNTLAMEGEAKLISDAEFSLFEDDPPPVYRSREGSPRPSSDGSRSESLDDDMEQQYARPRRGFGKTFSRQIIVIIAGYGILAYHSVSFDQLMPIFLSSPKSDDPMTLPFKFIGGLSLSTKSIGSMLAVQGVYSMIATLWLFPYVTRHFGVLRSLRFVVMIWPPLYFAVPYLVLLPSNFQIPAVYVALISKITLHVIAFPTINMLLANSAPSHSVLGSINGVAASVASLSRALGPTITGLLHSKGLESGFSIIAWWACGLICIVGAIESLFMEEDEEPRRFDAPEKVVGTEGIMGSPQRSESLFTASEHDTVPEEEVRLLSSVRTSSDLGSEASDMNVAIEDPFRQDLQTSHHV